jgi:hypothetical protein
MEQFTKLIYEGSEIEYNGYSLSGLYSFTYLKSGDTIYLSKTKINLLNKQ